MNDLKQGVKAVSSLSRAAASAGRAYKQAKQYFFGSPPKPAPTPRMTKTAKSGLRKPKPAKKLKPPKKPSKSSKKK